MQHFREIDKCDAEITIFQKMRLNPSENRSQMLKALPCLQSSEHGRRGTARAAAPRPGGSRSVPPRSRARTDLVSTGRDASVQAGRLAPSAKLDEAFELLALLFANLERIFSLLQRMADEDQP